VSVYSPGVYHAYIVALQTNLVTAAPGDFTDALDLPNAPTHFRRQAIRTNEEEK
jgi:hypothetical protein